MKLEIYNLDTEQTTLELSELPEFFSIRNYLDFDYELFNVHFTPRTMTATVSKRVR